MERPSSSPPPAESAGPPATAAPRRARGLLADTRAVVLETFHGFRADRGVDLAASLSFTTMLTAVPLMAAFALFLATFFKQNVAAIFDLVNLLLPYHTARVTDNLREFISESSAITGIGLAVLFIASLRLLFIVEGIVNTVWGAPSRRNWFSRIFLYTVGLLAFASLLGSITLGMRFLKRFAMANEILSAPVTDFLGPFAIEFAALALLYKLLPNARVRWLSATVGACAVALALELLRMLFGLYVQALSRVNLITGSLTLVLLSLLSIYFVWVLILLGVELTHALQMRATGRRTAGGPSAGRAENAIRILLCLSSGGTHPFRELYGEQEGSSAEAERILEGLRAKGLVEGDAARGFSLKRPATRITVAEVVDAVSADLYALTAREDDRLAHTLRPVFEHLMAERRALLGVTIADLIEKEPVES